MDSALADPGGMNAAVDSINNSLLCNSIGFIALCIRVAANKRNKKKI